MKEKAVEKERLEKEKAVEKERFEKEIVILQSDLQAKR